jgi:transposase
VEAFIEQHQQIKLHFLPAYSPKINAIERLWKIMHEHTTNNQYFASFKAFSEKIYPSHFKTLTFEVH